MVKSYLETCVSTVVENEDLDIVEVMKGLRGKSSLQLLERHQGKKKVTRKI